MSGDQFSQSQAECGPATVPPSAFLYGVQESIQSDSGSLASSNPYDGISRDSCLDGRFGVVYESDDFDPLGDLGLFDLEGLAESINPPGQPYTQPTWNDVLFLDQSREHYTDNGEFHFGLVQIMLTLLRLLECLAFDK
jgi:hypothetical protein